MSTTLNISKFLSSPETFSGTGLPDPLSWIQHLDRTRKAVGMTDEEALIVAASHFKGNAIRWWNIYEGRLTTWEDFEFAFKRQFISRHLEDSWWQELETIKQLPSQSIDDLTLRLRELFSYLRIHSESQMIRVFLRAVDDRIAYLLEQHSTLTEFDAVVNAARKLELVEEKYRVVQPGLRHQSEGPPSVSRRTWPAAPPSDQSTYPESFHSTLTQLAQGIDAIRARLNEAPVNVVSPVRNSGPRRIPTCFGCGQEGHIRPDCPNNQGEPPSNPVNVVEVFAAEKRAPKKLTPANPIARKGKEVERPTHQGPQGAYYPVPMEGISGYQQQGGLQPQGAPFVLPGVQVQGGIPIQGGYPGGPQVSQAHGGFPVVGGGVQEAHGVEGVVRGGGQEVQGVHKESRRKRAPPRRLPVELKKKDFWERLQSLDSGLSMADWLSLDKRAKDDVRDGLRYIYGRKDPQHSSAMVNMVKRNSESWDSESEFENSSNEDNESWEEEEASLGSEEAIASSASEAEYDSDDTEYSYQYNYQRFARSQPLKAPIMINGQVIEAIFDSGASVSVISKVLAKRLNLMPNGDQLPISSLDGVPHKPCDITVDVPIRVGGKLRPEAMCIQDSDSNRNLCLLGMTWCRAYGIQLRLQDSTIIVPTKRGTSFIEVQGRSDEMSEWRGEAPGVFSVTVRQEEVQSEVMPVLDQDAQSLLNYDEEVMMVSDSEEDLPEEIQSLVLANQDAF
ncbi:hypothetical protein INT47_012311, partial [Mucor saturninus]